MIERIIIKLLQARFQAMLAQPDQVHAVLRASPYCLTADEIDRYIQLLTENPPTFFQGADPSPPKEQKFPRVEVVPTGEDEDRQFLGHRTVSRLSQEFLAEMGLETLDGANGIGSLYSTGVELHCVSSANPDIALFLYALVKHCMTLERTPLQKLGLLDLHFSGGGLLFNASEHLPTRFFVRVFKVRCKYVYTVPDGFRRVGTVSGMSVNVESVQVNAEGTVPIDLTE